jgi:hypothetical protein
MPPRVIAYNELAWRIIGGTSRVTDLKRSRVRSFRSASYAQR